MTSLSRRNLIKASAFSALAQVGNSFLRPASLLAMTTPQTSSDYKALVCIALDGGCDGNNVIVPLDNTRYGLYSLTRGSLALDPASLHQVQNGANEVYGFHPSLSNLSSLYSSGQAAVLANAGPLTQLVTKNDYLNSASTIPSDLMNHERQRNQWGTSYTAPAAISNYTGWGGRVADSVAAMNTGAFPTVTCLTPGFAEQIFCYGKTSYPAVVSPGQAGVFPTDANTPLQLLAKLGSKGALVGAAASGLKDAMSQSALLASVLSSAPPYTTIFPNSALGAQLQQTLSMIAARTALGMQRQIFLCALQGFDNHQTQLWNQQVALTDLDNCLASFTAGLKELGLLNQVTTFTTSDFGRSLAANSSAGSDHGWGNHHMIIGGAVRGNRLYGSFPDLTPNSGDDLGQGRWIPSTSVDQYGATLASWFGVPDSQLTTLFPNLKNFTTPKLGFV